MLSFVSRCRSFMWIATFRLQTASLLQAMPSSFGASRWKTRCSAGCDKKKKAAEPHGSGPLSRCFNLSKQRESKCANHSCWKTSPSQENMVLLLPLSRQAECNGNFAIHIKWRYRKINDNTLILLYLKRWIQPKLWDHALTWKLGSPW